MSSLKEGCSYKPLYTGPPVKRVLRTNRKLWAAEDGSDLSSFIRERQKKKGWEKIVSRGSGNIPLDSPHLRPHGRTFHLFSFKNFSYTKEKNKRQNLGSNKQFQLPIDDAHQCEMTTKKKFIKQREAEKIKFPRSLWFALTQGERRRGMKRLPPYIFLNNFFCCCLKKNLGGLYNEMRARAVNNNKNGAGKGAIQPGDERALLSVQNPNYIIHARRVRSIYSRVWVCCVRGRGLELLSPLYFVVFFKIDDNRENKNARK